MATRRIGQSHVDHGAQFLFSRSESFASQIRELADEGLARHWSSREERHPVPVAEDCVSHLRPLQGMSAIAKRWAEGAEVMSGTRVVRLDRAKAWSVETEHGEIIMAKRLLLTPPAPQALALLDPLVERLDHELIEAVRSVRYEPCLALMGKIGAPGQLPEPGAMLIAEGPVRWIADGRFTRRNDGDYFIAHASPEFSCEHLEQDTAEVSVLLRSAVEELIGAPLTASQLHRWRYSRAIERVDSLCVRDAAHGLVVAGDGFGRGDIEGAVESGSAAAKVVSEML